MIAVKIGTVCWRMADELAHDEVEFDGELTLSLIWGNDVQTLREPTPTEAEAISIAAQRAAIPAVSRRQMLTALHRGGLLPAIRSTVAASGDIELQIAFDEALDFDRSNAFLTTMAAALGKSDAEVDAIFALAASI